MIPDRFMSYPKIIKVFLLILHLSIVMPIAVLYFIISSIFSEMWDISIEIIGMLKTLPKDCYEFVKYSSIKEYRTAKQEQYWKNIEMDKEEEE